MAKRPLTYEQIRALPLLEQALRLEEERHTARLAELQAAAKALAALEFERAEIERNGYPLFGSSISRGFMSNTLVYTGCIGEDAQVRLAKALLRSGWKVTDRDSGIYPSPTFRKGRINLRLSCTRAGTLEKAEQAVAAGPAKEAA